MDRILRLPEIMKIVGVSKATIQSMVRDGVFPKPFKISGRLAIGWPESTVTKWIQGKVDEVEVEAEEIK